MAEHPRLVTFAQLWSLVGHPSPRREWSYDRKFRAVRAAGFDAIMGAALPEFRELCARHELRFVGGFSSSQPREFAPALRAHREVGAEMVNVQLGDDFTTVEDAGVLVDRLLAAAAKEGIYAAVEVHRDTATETPEKLYAIADAYRARSGLLLPITWDHSHLAVVKHLASARYSEVLLSRPKLIQAARMFHCRPFNGHHCQAPVFDARRRLTPEFRAWIKFIEDLFRCWLAGSRPGNEIWVCPELGPHGVDGYNLSTMSPSWEQAKVCREELVKAWQRALGRRLRS